MSDHSANSGSSTQVLLSKVSRYEALFELTGVINAASDIESVGAVLARRLKYIADVYSWRYLCVDGDPGKAEGDEPTAVLVDGHRGKAEVTLTVPSALSSLERRLWHERKTEMLQGQALQDAMQQLPSHFRKDDLQQILVHTLVEDGRTQALHLFCRRRQPLADLDMKCLSIVCGFFHRKVHMLWEQKKLRDLEQAYLRQEVALRQNEKLATLGRLSAGMAHELNNPTAAASQGAEQLKSSMLRLERTQFALGAAGLSSQQQELIVKLEKIAEKSAKEPSPLDPILRNDLEQEVEDWLERNGIEEPWESASTFVTMGLDAAKLNDLTKDVDSSLVPVMIDGFGSQFTAYSLLEEIGHGAQRIAEIVKALKGYSYLDQAPIQSVDVREGLNDTLVMLGGRLRQGVTVIRDFAADLPRIEAYGSELNQVWTNLIDNAISAMAGKGTLELKAYGEDGWLVVEVADDGPGIPSEAQGKVFDPFFTTKPPGEGTGLGLNISHGIVVEKHRGQIAVESKPGATRFTVKLPIAESADAGGELENHG